MTDIQIIVGISGAGVALFIFALGWLLAHGNRLTAVEVKADGLKDRMDRHESQIIDTLKRIEDKLDRKVDR